MHDGDEWTSELQGELAIPCNSSLRRSCHRYQGKGYRIVFSDFPVPATSEAGLLSPVASPTGFLFSSERRPNRGGTTDCAFVPIGDGRVFIWVMVVLRLSRAEGI